MVVEFRYSMDCSVAAVITISIGDYWLLGNSIIFNGVHNMPNFLNISILAIFVKRYV